MTKEEVIQFWLESSDKDFQTMDRIIFMCLATTCGHYSLGIL